jgi:hypothetical protein
LWREVGDRSVVEVGQDLLGGDARLLRAAKALRMLVPVSLKNGGDSHGPWIARFDLAVLVHPGDEALFCELNVLSAEASSARLAGSLVEPAHVPARRGSNTTEPVATVPEWSVSLPAGHVLHTVFRATNSSIRSGVKNLFRAYLTQPSSPRPIRFSTVRGETRNNGAASAMV